MRSPDDFDHRQNGADDGEGEKENTDVFEGVGLKPADDLPSVKESQDSLHSESQQAGYAQRYEEERGAHFESTSRENTRCEWKRGWNQIEDRQRDGAFVFDASLDTIEPSFGNKMFQTRFTQPAADVKGDRRAAK